MIDKLIIGGIPYEIDVKEDLHTLDEEGHKRWLNGTILYGNLYIGVNDEIPDELRPAVIMHEALHGVLYQAGHEEQDEAQVLALGYGVVALMRENPAFVDWIMGKTDNGSAPAPTA